MAAAKKPVKKAVAAKTKTAEAKPKVAEAKPKAVAAKPAAKPAGKKAPAKGKSGAKAPAKAHAPVAVVKKAPKAVAPVKPARVRKSKDQGAVAIERSDRKIRTGVVVSNKMEKTVVVKIERRTQHPLYGKVVIRSNKFKAHDLVGCDEGDLVEIMETRPMSRDKRWRVTQILEKVK